MASCSSGIRIARDHMHTDITTGSTEESQQKYRLVTDINRLQGGQGGEGCFS